MSNLSPELERKIKSSSLRSSIVSLIGAFVALIGFGVSFLGVFSENSENGVIHHSETKSIPIAPIADAQKSINPKNNSVTTDEIEIVIHQNAILNEKIEELEREIEKIKATNEERSSNEHIRNPSTRTQ